MHFIISGIAFLITIALVIGIHEFGHFLAARLLGIKVLTFSIGFGKKIFKWKDKKGTEYAVSAIPIGGYVKMLDEREGKVKKEELSAAFDHQPIFKRIIIICAGPFFNLVLALLAYWIMFMVGFTTVKPIIGEVAPNSIAAQAGLKPQQEIIAIDNRTTPDWNTVTMATFFRIGDTGQMQIKTKQLETKEIQTFFMKLHNWQLDGLRPDPIKSLGIEPYKPEIPAIIGELDKASQEVKSKLKVGDRILAIDNIHIKDWYELANQIRKSPNKTLAFKIKRADRIIEIAVPISAKGFYRREKIGVLGVIPEFKWPPELINENQYSLLPAFVQAYKHASNFIGLNFLLIGKLIVGDLSIRSLGGPITIFESAGAAFYLGLATFLSFLGFVSITIGIINILPIPGLDGGHVCYLIIEAITRRPVSMKVQMFAFRIGIMVLVLIMIQALLNDVLRMAY